MSEEEDVCGFCDLPVRDRSKASKVISCKKCEKPYHVKCSGLLVKKFNELISKNIPWFCASCKRKSQSGDSFGRAKSVSDEHIHSTPASNSTEDVMLLELQEMSSKLVEMKSTALRKTNPEEGDATGEAGKGEKWQMIWKKIDLLINEIEIIRKIVHDQGRRIVQLETSLTQQCNENEKLKAEVASVKKSHEIDKQKAKLGDVLICGLPVEVTVDPEQVFIKMCQKLRVDQSSYSNCKPAWRVMKVENNAVKEQRIEIKNLGPAFSSMVIQNYKEARKRNDSLISLDLVDEGDTKPIYINESLTGYYQLLFKKARDMRRKGQLKFVWINGGMLFVRKDERSKIFQINHQNELEKFK